MKLKELLNQKKDDILGKWFDSIINTYPVDTSRILKTNKDQFANPVGNTFSEEIGVIFDGLLGRTDPERVELAIDRIVRIRAVQDFSASQVVDFLFFLKEIVHKEFGDMALEQELLVFGSEIDGLALKGFDIYMNCCRQLYEIRATEVKNNMHMLLRRANMTA
jgi:hypothetical protein